MYVNLCLPYISNQRITRVSKVKGHIVTVKVKVEHKGNTKVLHAAVVL